MGNAKIAGSLIAFFALILALFLVLGLFRTY